DDVVGAAVLPDVMDGNDVRMVEPAGYLRLINEALDGLLVFLVRFGKKLDGDEAVQDRVLALVNHAHAALADAAVNLILADDAADARIGLPAEVAVRRSGRRRGALPVDGAGRLRRSLHGRLWRGDGHRPLSSVSGIEKSSAPSGSPREKISGGF